MFGATTTTASSVSALRPEVIRARSAHSPRPQANVVRVVKSGVFAAVLSFFFCGLGHIYLGQFRTGIALMVGFSVVLFLGVRFLLPILQFIAVIMWIYGMAHSYRVAEQMNEQNLLR